MVFRENDLKLKLYFHYPFEIEFKIIKKLYS